MAIVFPASPSVNETFTAGSITYKWDGDKWIGLGVTPTDRLLEGSNSLEIDANNNLIWSGGDVGIGTSTINQSNASRQVLSLNGTSNALMNFNHGDTLAGFLYGANDEFRMESAGTRPLIFRTDFGESFRIEADSGRILKGWGDTAFSGTGQSSDICVAGTSSNNGLQVIRYNGTYGAYGLTIGRSRSGTLGTHGQVLSNDSIGSIDFVASDGANFRQSAQIEAAADGTITSSSTEGKIIFKTAKVNTNSATQAMTIKANHNVEIHDGNIVFETSGTGIDFSATADSGGSGVTNRSELLDDYEEGDWIPTMYGSTTAGTTTYSHQTGHYTKIGNRVIVSGTMAATITGAGGDLRIGNFPFVADDESVGTFQCNDLASWGSGVEQYSAIIQTGNSYCHFRGTKQTTTYSTLPIQDVSYLRFNISYQTNS